jgi:hypothetical protein
MSQSMEVAEDLSSIVAQKIEADKEDQEREYNDGVKEGRRWASSKAARPAELRRLEKWDREGFGGHPNMEANQEVAIVIRGSGKRDRDWFDFWTVTLEDEATRSEDFDFVRGFADGAEARWKEIEAASNGQL